VAEGGVSISWVAVQLARRIFDRIDRCHVLLLGAGEMAELAALHLHEQGARSLTVANRTLSRAEQVAHARGWKAAGLADLEELLRDVDIVIASTGSALPIVTAPTVKRALRRRGSRPLFFIDIAVPRDVEPAVGEIDGVYLYNIDDLQAVADRNRDRRASEAHLAEEIVRDEVEKFANWIATQATSPVIAALRQRLMEVREQELSRSHKALMELGETQRQAVERLTESMISKIASGPILRLKTANNPRDVESLTWALRELFGLADLALLDAEQAEPDLDTIEFGDPEGFDGPATRPTTPTSSSATPAPQQRRMP
jgi:glutamyl-tRNA reductase